jgi:hypothetical protein
MEPGLAGEDVAEAFSRDGVVCVRSAVDTAQAAAAADAIEAVLASPGPLAQVARRPDDPRRLYRGLLPLA